MKYRRKPIVVDAVQFDPNRSWPAGVVSWREAPYQPRDMSWGYINTPDGKKHVQLGDWILTSASGEKYLYDADTFYSEYEPIEE